MNAQYLKPSRKHMNNKSDMLNYTVMASNNEVIPFIITHQSDLPDVCAIIKKHWPKIESSMSLNKILTNKPVIA